MREIAPDLSEKRRRAGRRGAEARWKTSIYDRPEPWKTTRPVAKLREGRTDWYRIENHADSADIYIYDEIGYLAVTASDFIRELRDIHSDQIQLHLNTPGGDVFDGIAIYNALKDHSAEVVVTVDGLAASAGSFIAQAGDKVVMTKNSSLMIHDAHGLAIGNAEDMRGLADILDKQSDNIASIYAERAGGSVEDWRTAMKAESWYSADEAVAAGLADEIKGSSNGKNSFDLSIYGYAGRPQAPAPVIPERKPVDVNQLQDALRKAFS